MADTAIALAPWAGPMALPTCSPIESTRPMTLFTCTRPRPRIILVSQSEISSRFVLILYRLAIDGLGVVAGLDTAFGTPNKKPPIVPAKNAAPDANQSMQKVRTPDRKRVSAENPYASSINQPNITAPRKPQPANFRSLKILLTASCHRERATCDSFPAACSVICRLAR